MQYPLYSGSSFFPHQTHLKFKEKEKLTGLLKVHRAKELAGLINEPV